MGLFSRDKSSVLGVYFDDMQLWWVVCSTDDSTPKVDAHGSITLEQGVVIDGAIVDGERFVRQMHTLAAFGDMPMTVTVSHQQTLSHEVSVDIRGSLFRRRRVIGESLATYIKTRLGMSNDEMLCEYEVLNSTRDQAEVYATLYNKETIRQYQKVFRELGFSDIHFESMHHAIDRLQGSGPGEALFLAIGSLRSALTVMREGRVQAVYESSFSTHQLEQLVAGELGIGLDTARDILYKHGIRRTHRDQRVYTIVHHALGVLASDVQQALRRHGDIQTVVISGSGSILGHIVDFLDSRLQRQVQTIDVWRAFRDVSAEVPPIDAHQMLAFAPALSAALEGLRN